MPCGFGRHSVPLARAGYRVDRRRPLGRAARRGAPPRRRRALAEVGDGRLPRAAVRRRELRRRDEPVQLARLPRRRGGHARAGRDPPRAAAGRAARGRADAPRPARARVRRAGLAAARRGPPAARAAHVRRRRRRRADDADADRRRGRPRVAHVLRARLQRDRAGGDARRARASPRSAPTATSTGRRSAWTLASWRSRSARDLERLASAPPSSCRPRRRRSAPARRCASRGCREKLRVALVERERDASSSRPAASVTRSKPRSRRTGCARLATGSWM